MQPPFRVLWICTANACRSQMAEAILRHVGGGRFVALSAGVCPTDRVHPLAEAGLAPLGISLGSQYSKGCEEMLAIEHDIIITVCDAAACVLPSEWEGEPIRVHWSLPDPVMYPGTELDRAEAAAKVAQWLRDKIERLVSMPLETMDHEAIRKELAEMAGSW